MTDAWAEAQRLFTQWPRVEPNPGSDGASRRLGDALRGIHNGTAGWRDVVALTRQVLLEARARNNLSPLTVPVDPSLPGEEQWRAALCEVQPSAEALRVWARPWSPGAPGGPAARAAEADLTQVALGLDSTQRRRLDNCPADPFWTASLGHDYYLSIGQRQAARSVALAPAGSTTIVCLPTGHGKTDVILAPALLNRGGTGTCLIAVPTVVLAIDMERRVRRLLEVEGIKSPGGRYAYTGDLPEDARWQIISNIRSGRQRVLIAAPEAVTRSLLRPLEDAARAGFLTHFVIDEAHLVEQWGNEFRPAFQTIASQRQAWIRLAPPGHAPRTVALSATLTAAQVETLKALFGAPGPTEIVWASQLRSEPSYYVDSFPDRQGRQEAVLDAVTLLPRPMALYVTKRDDAALWVSLLRDQGLHRVTEVTGGSDTAGRRRVIEGWALPTAHGDIAPSRFDVVVGTSAFGLGVDLPDVKTVVHACIPETVDRYYQEVGRGGRNGSPSLSYMATVTSDMPIAEELNELAIITADRAWQRWDSMFQARQPGDGPVYHLDLDARPGDLSEGYGLNRTWNIRVLNLMARAKLIELLVPEAPPPGDDSSEFHRVGITASPERVLAPMNVSLEDGQTNDPGHFREVLTTARTQILAAQKAALARLRTALRGDHCISDVLAGYYVVPSPEGVLLTSPWCRGCPFCRRNGPVDGFCRVGWQPHPVVTVWPRRDSDPLAEFRAPGQANLSIWWETDRERLDLLPELVTRLCRAGIPVIGGPGLTSGMAALIQRDARPHAVILDHDADLLVTYAGPVIWVLDTRARLEPPLLGRIESSDVTYLLHPRELEQPGKPGSLFADIHTGSISMRTARRAL
jgi:ATP-dependent DNA helicase RecQ